MLLANDLQKALHADDFLRYVLDRFPDTTFWLTTHCHGDARVPMAHIGHLFEPDVQKLMTRIKPTSWDLAKTRAIDFSQPFLWFDDDLFSEERTDLIHHGALDNWIEVDLSRNPHQLQDFVSSFPLPANT